MLQAQIGKGVKKINVCTLRIVGGGLRGSTGRNCATAKKDLLVKRIELRMANTHVIRVEDDSTYKKKVVFLR